jgi:lysophospholipase L1-like esterase
MPRTADFAEEIRLLNRQYLRLAETRATVTYLDLWPALADENGLLARRYTLDRLHLNGAGYRAWVDVLRPLVADVAQGPTP